MLTEQNQQHYSQELRFTKLPVLLFILHRLSVHMFIYIYLCVVVLFTATVAINDFFFLYTFSTLKGAAGGNISKSVSCGLILVGNIFISFSFPGDSAGSIVLPQLENKLSFFPMIFNLRKFSKFFFRPYLRNFLVENFQSFFFDLT